MVMVGLRPCEHWPSRRLAAAWPACGSAGAVSQPALQNTGCVQSCGALTPMRALPGALPGGGWAGLRQRWRVLQPVRHDQGFLGFLWACAPACTA